MLPQTSWLKFMIPTSKEKQGRKGQEKDREKEKKGKKKGAKTLIPISGCTTVITWLVSATVDVLQFVEAVHNRLPFVVDVIKRRRLERQLSSDVLTHKYILHNTHHVTKLRKPRISFNSIHTSKNVCSMRT